MVSKKGRKSIQVQAWLHPEKVQEADACEILTRYRNIGWKDREIIREALNALKMQVDQGWQPRRDVDNVYINNSTVLMLEQMRALVARLAALDLSGARPVSQQEFDQIRRDMNQFEQSAAAMMGGALFFDDEDE